jgi:hypothetical protein
MTFAGVAVVKQVADGLVRITGLTLPGDGTTGTIGLHENAGAPDVRLPEGFKPRAYSRPDEALDVGLQDAVEVWFSSAAAGAAPSAISVAKTGTNPEDFGATLTNNATGGAATFAFDNDIRDGQFLVAVALVAGSAANGNTLTVLADGTDPPTFIDGANAVFHGGFPFSPTTVAAFVAATAGSAFFDTSGSIGTVITFSALLTLHDGTDGGGDSGELEIYVRFH